MRQAFLILTFGLGLAACVTAQGTEIEVPGGAVRVVEDETLPRFGSAMIDGVQVEIAPAFGGLLALEPDGSPLAFEDQARAVAALTAYCGAPPADLSYRSYGEENRNAWTSAPCGEV